MSVVREVEFKGNFQVSDYDGPSNPFYDLEGMQDFYFVYDENMSQVALEKIFKALYMSGNPNLKEELIKACEKAKEDKSRELEALNKYASDMEKYEYALDEVNKVLSKASTAKANFEFVLTELIGENFKSKKPGGMLGELMDALVVTKSELGNGGYLNCIPVQQCLDDLAIVIEALQKHQIMGGRKWNCEFSNDFLIYGVDPVTIDNFDSGWSSRVQAAMNRLYNIFCHGLSLDSLPEISFAFATKSVANLPDELKKKDNTGKVIEAKWDPILTKDSAVYTWGDVISFREEKYSWSSDFVKECISEEYLADCINKLPGTSYYYNAFRGLNKGAQNAHDYYKRLNDRISQKEDGKWYYDDSVPYPGTGADDHFKPDYDRGKGFDTREECFKRMAKATWAGRHLFCDIYLPNNRNEVAFDPNSTALKDKMWDWLVNNNTEKVNAVRTSVLGRMSQAQKNVLDERSKSCMNILDSDGYFDHKIKEIERCIYGESDGMANINRPNKDEDTSTFKKNSGVSGLLALTDVYKHKIENVEAARIDLVKKYGAEGVLGGDKETVIKDEERLNTFISKLESSLNTSQNAYDNYYQGTYLPVKEAYDAAMKEYNTWGNVETSELLDLALRYNAFDGGQDILDANGKIQKITKITYENGTYRVTGVTEVGKKSAVNAEDAMKDLAIPYYALTICLEKANIVKDVMVAQVQILQDINDSIEKNNEYLRDANKCYEKYYEKCVSNIRWRSYNHTTGFGRDLDRYVTNECGYEFNSRDLGYGQYNKEGTSSTSNGFTNIDVVEQGNLTKISNAQEAIRMKGDELNTSSQMATTKLQQYTQNYNSSISIASQLAKSVGENFKNIASNVR